MGRPLRSPTGRAWYVFDDLDQRMIWKLVDRTRAEGLGWPRQEGCSAS